MRTLTTIGCALAMVVAGGLGRAAAQDAKAAEVLAKTREALGTATIERIRTLSIEASMQRNVGQMQMSSDVEMLFEMPDKFVRSEISRGGMNMTMSTGFNGENAILPAGATMTAPGAMVIRMGPGGPINDGPKLTDEQKAQMNAASLRAARAELSRMMLGWFGMAHPTLKAEYTYAGEAQSPDGKAHVIDVKDGDGFEARLFIDQNNHLPLMVTYKGRQPRMVTSRMPAGGGAAPQGSAQARQLTDEERKKLQEDSEARIKQELAAEAPLVEFSLFFDDWREVDGLQFPHVMRRGTGGETNEEWTFNKVKLNPKIDARKFDVSR